MPEGFTMEAGALALAAAAGALCGVVAWLNRDETVPSGLFAAVAAFGGLVSAAGAPPVPDANVAAELVLALGFGVRGFVVVFGVLALGHLCGMVLASGLSALKPHRPDPAAAGRHGAQLERKRAKRRRYRARRKARAARPCEDPAAA